jgi:hypothetical protein
MGTVRIRGYIESYTEPEAAAPSGRPYAQTPPLPGTLQYWRSENANLPSGTTNYDLVNGIGFPLRNVIYKSIRTSSGLRSDGDADWPDPATLTYGNVTLFQRSKNLWIDKLGRDFGLITISGDTALGRENGVFPVWMTKDFQSSPGDELRYKYLQTMVNTVLRLTGSFGNADTLFALTNWIKPSNSDYFSLLPGR